MQKYLSKTTVGWVAIGFGVFTAVSPAWAATTAAGAACTLALGIFTAYFGALGLLVRNPTPTHWVPGRRRSDAGYGAAVRKNGTIRGHGRWW